MRSKLQRNSIVFVLSILFCPISANANALAPLVWAGFFHLAIGNFLIGFFEALLVSKIFKCKFLRAAWLLILANYVSSIIGIFAVHLFSSSSALFPTESLFRYAIVFLVIGISLLWLLTIIIESPFVYWCFVGDQRIKFGKALKISLLVQTISYAFLVPYYLRATETSLLTETKVERDLSFVRDGNYATVYFIGYDLKSLWSVKANGNDKKKIVDVSATEEKHLCFTSKVGRNSVDLSLCKVKKRYPEFEIEAQVLVPDIASRNEVSHQNIYEGPSPKNNYSLDSAGGSHTSYLNSNSIWDGHCGSWVEDGLLFHKREESERFIKDLERDMERQREMGRTTITTMPATYVRSIAMETPFQHWYCRNLTVLPTEQFVVQFGPYIVLLDPETKQIGYLISGYAHLVVWDK